MEVTLVQQNNIFDDFARVAQLLPAPIYWLDKRTAHLCGNKRFYSIVGFDENADDFDELNHKKHAPEFTTYKSQVFNEKGEVVGLVGTLIEITDDKEAQRFKLEEKEKLITLARTVAHDVSSPLSVLSMMMQVCDELQEEKRLVINGAVASIFDIANSLLNTYRNGKQGPVLAIEPRTPLLISDLLVQLLSEKRAQYSDRSIRFESAIDDDAQFAFALMQVSQFKRSISNLINNAADAMVDRSDGVVTVKLAVNTKSVMVAIQDNGKGISRSMVEKILNRKSFTDGKEHGHGIGLQQVWNTLDDNQGIMMVNSHLGVGTSIQLTFPRVEAPSWIAQEIQPLAGSIVVILHDKESIHGAWDMRFKSYLMAYPKLRLLHYRLVQLALAFFKTLNPADKERVIFLIDYELISRHKGGLQIIEESGIKNVILTTCHYADSNIRDRAARLGAKILPKQMASIVPIKVAKD